MATLEALAIKAEAAVKRIEKRAEELGVKTAPLPLTNKDRDILRMNQLERIADIMEAIPDDEQDPRLVAAIDLVSKANWTKAELEAILLGGDDGTI